MAVKQVTIEVVLEYDKDNPRWDNEAVQDALQSTAEEFTEYPVFVEVIDG